MSRVKALIVDPQGFVTYGTIDRDLETFQGIVEGYLEGINGDDFFAYCNEEGKLRNLPFNPVATAALGYTHDPVCGTVLFLGPIENDGDETDVTVEVVQRVIKASEALNREVRA